MQPQRPNPGKESKVSGSGRGKTKNKPLFRPAGTRARREPGWRYRRQVARPIRVGIRAWLTQNRQPFTGSGALDGSLAHAEPATSLTKSPKLRRGQLSFLSRTPETGSRRTASEVQESSSVGWRQAHEEPPPPDRAGNQSQAHEEPAVANAGHSQGSLSGGVNRVLRVTTN